MNFVILVYTLYLVRLYLGLKIPPNANNSMKVRSFKELLECRICMDLFSYDFNYDQYLKNKEALDMMKNFIKESKQKYLGDEEEINNSNIEIISRELSMKYFFKGGEIDNFEKVKSCKNKTLNDYNSNNNFCELTMSKACEYVMSMSSGKCFIEKKSKQDTEKIEQSEKIKKKEKVDKIENLNQQINQIINNKKEDLETKNTISITKELENKKINLENIDLTKLQTNFFNSLQKDQSFSLPKSNFNYNKLNQPNQQKFIKPSKNNDFKSKLLQLLNKNISSQSQQQNLDLDEKEIDPQFQRLKGLSQMLNLENENIVKPRNSKFLFKPKPKKNNNQPSNNLNEILNLLNANKTPNINHSSLLELAPEVVEKEYTPRNPDSKPWLPPKPVIFDNFQDSLGNQLKDISFLTK